MTIKHSKKPTSIIALSSAKGSKERLVTFAAVSKKKRDDNGASGAGTNRMCPSLPEGRFSMEQSSAFTS